MTGQGLNPPTLFKLDLACRPIRKAFGHSPYLVGSVQNRTAQPGSDVDVRLILPDDEYDEKIQSANYRTMLDLAFGAYLREITGLPIDFQIQRMTEANANHSGQRNPLGQRRLSDWKGDAAPEFTWKV